MITQHKSDDILPNITDVALMLQELNEEPKRVELRTKAKLMSPGNTQTYIDNTVIEHVKEYNYLGHVITAEKEKKSISWDEFGKTSYILRNNAIPINLRSSLQRLCSTLCNIWDGNNYHYSNQYQEIPSNGRSNGEVDAW